MLHDWTQQTLTAHRTVCTFRSLILFVKKKKREKEKRKNKQQQQQQKTTTNQTKKKNPKAFKVYSNILHPAGVLMENIVSLNSK